MENKLKKNIFWLDPRAKIVVILLCGLSSLWAPSLLYQLVLVFWIGILGVFSGKYKFALKSSLFYLGLFLGTLWLTKQPTSTLRTTLLAFLGLFHKVYPSGMLAVTMLSTTKVSEFLAAMSRLKVPKSLYIPLAVMLRYLPTIQEDWHYIKDAMKLRGIAPSIVSLVKKPKVTLTCFYVPLMMAASKAADELSIAALTRGIENPKPRTSFVQISWGILDSLVVLFFSFYGLLGLILH